MSPRDRDRSFEKALARNLASSASSPLCPDPETLAAYHENALAPEELLSWKKHFASCLRCQELLKHLAATDNQPLPSLETARPEAAAAPPYTVTGAPRPRLRWASYWRWAVPAGALAAGLLVWVAIRPTPSSKLETAQNQQVPPLSANSSPASPNPGVRASREADRDLAFERAPAADASKARAKGRPERKALAATAQKSVPPSAPAQNAAGARGPSEPERTENFLYRQGPAVQSRDAASVSDSAARLQQEPRGMLPPQSQTQSLMVTPETASAQPSKALPTASEKLHSVNGRVTFLKAKAESPPMILAPEGHVLWLVGTAGMIERSADGGRSWVVQTSGVATDLLAGSAVSDQVCWIIGRAGTILRTTDGGAHWRKLPSPSAEDLAAVNATDALQAVIFDATKKRAYKTTDGGASWTPLPAK